MDDFPQRFPHCRRISIGFSDQCHPFLRTVRVRQIQELSCSFEDRKVFSGYGHPNNFDPWAVSADAYPLSSRISTEVMTRESFVDYRNRRGIRSICLQESAAGKNWGSECLKVVVAYVIPQNTVNFLARSKLVAFGKHHFRPEI